MMLQYYPVIQESEYIIQVILSERSSINIRDILNGWGMRSVPSFES